MYFHKFQRYSHTRMTVSFSYHFLWPSSKTYREYLPIPRGFTIGKVMGRDGSNIKQLYEQLHSIARNQCYVKVICDERRVRMHNYYSTCS